MNNKKPELSISVYKSIFSDGYSFNIFYKGVSSKYEVQSGEKLVVPYKLEAFVDNDVLFLEVYE